MPSAHTDLEAAGRAVAAHDAPGAIAALDHASAAGARDNQAYGNARVDVFTPEVLQQIAPARQAVRMGNWGAASHYVDAALTHPGTLAR